MLAAIETPPASSALSPAHLDREVREIMTPGVLTIVEDATVRQARRAIRAHRVHGVLVVGRSQGRPLGWVTARGLLDWITKDESLAAAREAITEAPAVIEPSAHVHEAIRALSHAGVSHLLVQRRHDVLPEGVVSHLDLLDLGDPQS
jgi:CBS domain-containing protein